MQKGRFLSCFEEQRWLLLFLAWGVDWYLCVRHSSSALSWIVPVGRHSWYSPC